MPGEPQKAFQAFRMYRDMGADRTINNVRLSLGKSEGYQTALEIWSFKYKWVERAGLYDAHLDRQSMKVAEEGIKHWEVLRQRSLEANIHTAQMMRERLHQMLQWPIAKEIEKDVNGRVIKIIQPSRWTFNTVVNLAKMTAELEAATIAEALAGAEDANFDPETASLEELKQYVERHKQRGK